MPRALAALTIIVLLTACASSQPVAPSRTSATVPPSPAGMPSASLGPTITVMASTTNIATPRPTNFSVDCLFVADIYAWYDLDEDGQPGGDEPPLAGVTIRVDITIVTTDASGEAHHSRIGSCQSSALDAIATAPPGYRLTTPGRMAVPLRTSATPEYVRFGFAKESP